MSATWRTEEAESTDATQISALIGRNKPAFCLEQPFYVNPGIFDCDRDRLFDWESRL